MPKFRVIRASAGSGKTFSLTGEYLRILLTGHDAFIHILAVTFTNKATEEMKSRIIRELYLLSSGQQSKQLKGLIGSTGISEEAICKKSSVILRRLLHNYSRFSVNTIDSFFQRIIRNFTRELGIQEGYLIELDTESVLTEAIGQLLVMAGHDKALLSWLSRFAESLIEKGESWNLKTGIKDLGKEIFSEEFKGLNEDSIKLFSDREYLAEYRDTLYAIQQKIENTYKAFGIKATGILKSHGLTVDDFSMQGRGPAGYLVKTADGSFKEPTGTARQAATDIQKWYRKASPLKDVIANVAEKELMPIISEAIAYYDDNHITLSSAKVILKNLFTLGILSDLSRRIDSWCAESNTFLLTEAPVFLNRIIDGNDTPFIYEKAGCWYHHFMIDEFQDTSVMQWNNFKPLISNSLSQNFDNLAVGDTKQSIYRWRNSNWEILETRINNEFLDGIVDPVTLKDNWRSLENIITFNNNFFSKAASVLQEDFEHDATGDFNITPLTELYRDLEQRPGGHDKAGGYVNVQFISNEEESRFKETVNNEVVNLLYDLLDHGYDLKDIAILTRTNSEAAALADFLLKNHSEDRHLDVISDEALHLGSSIVVKTIVALLQYIVDPSDITNNYFISSSLSNYLNNRSDAGNWIHQVNHTGFTLPNEFNELSASAKSYSLVEIVERLIRIFDIEKFEGEQVYLVAFRDLVLEYTKNRNSDITRFLQFWSENGINKSVAAPSGQDAVRILTMHKAKGLEFKVTIIPYCMWELNSFSGFKKSYLWCRPAVKPFDRLPVIPLLFGKNLKDTIFAEDYYKESYKQLVDNLNLLYVAFTRAREALYVFCKDNDEKQLKTVSGLTGRIVGNNPFILGNLPVQKPASLTGQPEKFAYQPVPLTTVSGRIKIAFQGKVLIDPSVERPSRPLNEGSIMHEIFTLIRIRKDVKTAVSRMHLQGRIASGEQDRYIRFIENAMNNIQVQTWFTNDWEVLNEAEIIIPGGDIRRPDRVMTRKDQTMIIDYKFGTKTSSSDESQIREYGRLLEAMGYKGVEAYLWYVKLGKVILVNGKR